MKSDSVMKEEEGLNFVGNIEGCGCNLSLLDRIGKKGLGVEVGEEETNCKALNSLPCLS